MSRNVVDESFLLRRRLAEAVRGNADACFELGLHYASGADEEGPDYIEAHKWFNIAAMSGDHRAQECRAELASEMSRDEIANAQRAARAWLSQNVSVAA
jgi:TPR repeat protein